MKYHLIFSGVPIDKKVFLIEFALKNGFKWEGTTDELIYKNCSTLQYYDYFHIDTDRMMIYFYSLGDMMKAHIISNNQPISYEKALMIIAGS